MTRRIAAYLAIFALLFASISIFMQRQIFDVEPRANGVLLRRMPWYLARADEFDLVFLGDSRTYCGVQPDWIDDALGTHSINMAQFAHWLPTQIPQIEALLEAAPPHTLFVWSLGHKNFLTPDGVYRSFPIDLGTALLYLNWGYPLSLIADNVAYFHPLGTLYQQLGDLRAQSQAFLQRSLFGARESATPDALEAEVARLEAQYRADPRNRDVNVTVDEGRITSVELYRDRGSYLRVVIDHAYFEKWKQRDLDNRGGALATESEAQEAFDAWLEGKLEPYLIESFRYALARFRDQGARLVVNEISEARYTHRHPWIERRWQRFMRDRIEPIVHEYGFDYVRTDWQSLSDDDFFDYNHLNTVGNRKYSAMLVEALRPYVAGKS